MAKDIQITYRSACPNDIEPIRRLLKATGLYFAPFDDNPGWYEEKWRHDPSSIIIAEDRRIVIGMVMFTFDPVLSVIAHLSVAPEYQRQGIGRKLFKQALRRIKTKGGNFVAGYIVQDNETSITLCKNEGLETYDKPLTLVYRTLE